VQIIVRELRLKNPSVANVAARRIVLKWLSMKETNALAGVQTNAQADVQTTVLCVTSSVFLKHKQLLVVPPVSNSIPSMFNCLLLGILSSHSIVRFGQDLVPRRHSLRDRMNTVTSI
jgi:hypothetical protein